jgi:hypothetical protein
LNSQRCVDTCCGDGTCTNGTVCAFTQITGPGGTTHGEWACMPPNDGGNPNGESCPSRDVKECANNNCVGNDPKCAPSCCSAAECEAAGFSGGACAYGNTGSGGDQLRWCIIKSLLGNVPEGAPCPNGDNDCSTHLCDKGTGTCVHACCTSTDCGPGQSCKPTDGTPRLRCVKN